MNWHSCSPKGGETLKFGKYRSTQLTCHLLVMKQSNQQTTKQIFVLNLYFKERNLVTKMAKADLITKKVLSQDCLLYFLQY